MGEYWIGPGVTSSGLVLNEGDFLLVNFGGTAVLTTIREDGGMEVDGSALSTTISSGGEMEVDAGGSAAYVFIKNGGTLIVNHDARAVNVEWTPGVGAVELEDGSYISFTNSYSGVYFASGGNLLSNTSVMTGKTVGGNCSAIVMSGGTASSFGISNGGCVELWSGGSADAARVSRYGMLIVRSGCTATNVAWTPTVGEVYWENGAVVMFANSYSGVYYGNGASLLSHAAVLTGKVVSGDDNEIQVWSGGTAVMATVRGDAEMWVEFGGTATKTAVEEGEMDIRAGGLALSTTVSGRDAEVYVSSGGVASRTEIVSGGLMKVVPGGSAVDTVVNQSGTLKVRLGGTAVSTTVSSGGVLLLNGTAVDVTVDYQGDMEISSGGTAAGTIVGSKGLLVVSGGGTASGVTVNSRGALNVDCGGTASSVVAGSKAYLAIDGTICGIRLENAVDGFIGPNAEVSFDLTARKTFDPAVVNNLAALMSLGTPDFTITVSATQTEGVYTLAENVVYFGGETFTISDTRGESADLAVGSTVTLSDRDYTLNLDSDTLTLTVSGDPVVPISPGDLNGDGRADVVMSITQPGHGAEGATGAWLVQENQTAVWGDLSQRNAGWEIFGMGVTTAGKATNDVYVKNADNVIGAWVTDDTGHVSGWETVGQFDDSTQILGLGDFNADGQTDLLLRNVNGAVGCFFTGGETTGWNYFQSLGDEWKIAAVGDLNGDGRDDVVLKHDAGFAGSWLTQSDGTMAWSDLDTVGEGFAIAGAGDFNGDGIDDVLLQKGTYFGAWLVRDGSAQAWFGLGDLGSVAVEQIADFDGDGTDDLRVRTSAGDLGAQLVKGADTLEWRYYGSVGNEWSTSLAAI